jgi:threonine dehydrogenase-like Zn-dependent dehydrogenase
MSSSAESRHRLVKGSPHDGSDDCHSVLVVGAGPAGLMLAYVLPPFDPLKLLLSLLLSYFLYIH